MAQSLVALPVLPLFGVGGGYSNNVTGRQININGNGNKIYILGGNGNNNSSCTCQNQNRSALMMQYMTRIMSQFMKMFEQLFGQLLNSNQCGCGCGYTDLPSVYACNNGGWNI